MDKSNRQMDPLVFRDSCDEDLKKVVRSRELTLYETVTRYVYGEPVKKRVPRVFLRFDDSCGNGYNYFSITSENGCDHERVVKLYPELEPFIKWHLCSPNGPMHYLANTMYHASDKDCWGRQKGEPYRWTYHLQAYHKDKTSVRVNTYPTEEMLQEAAANLTPFIAEGATLICEPEATAWGVGREPDLEYARSCAVAPDATLEQLRSKEWLEARLPALIDEFMADMEKIPWSKSE